MAAMSAMNDLWVSLPARYDKGVFRAREEIERHWPDEASMCVRDVKGHFHDFLVLAQSGPDEENRAYAAVLMISGHELRHSARDIVRLCAENMEIAYERRFMPTESVQR